MCAFARAPYSSATIIVLITFYGAGSGLAEFLVQMTAVKHWDLLLSRRVFFSLLDLPFWSTCLPPRSHPFHFLSVPAAVSYTAAGEAGGGRELGKAEAPVLSGADKAAPHSPPPAHGCALLGWTAPVQTGLSGPGCGHADLPRAGQTGLSASSWKAGSMIVSTRIQSPVSGNNMKRKTCSY